jgi:magnesium transporter
MSINLNTNTYNIPNSQNSSGYDSYEISEDLRIRILNAIELNLKSQIRKLFPDLHPADQASFIYNINSEQREKLVQVLGNKFDPEVLVHLEGDTKEEIIGLLDLKDLAEAVSKLDTDEAVEIIDELEDNIREKILNEIRSVKKREEIEEGLSYEEDTVGRLMMHKGFVAIPKDWTVGEVIKYVKSKKDLPSDFRDIIVVDDYFKPVATVSVSQIIRHKDSKKIYEIMNDPEELKVLTPNTEQEEASHVFTKYDLTSAPVVDDKGILVGVILLSDIIDVIEEEASEDILYLGNVSEDDVYSGILSSAKNRFPWLLASLIATTIGSTVIAIFSGTVQKLVILASLTPIIAGLGGISSNQTLTVLVRNLATKKVNSKNALRVIFKEMFTGMFNGTMIAICASSILFLIKHNIRLSLVFGGTLIFTITMSGLLATLIPLTFNKMKLDPAITSSAFITTTIDALSFLAFLGMATLFIL